VPLAVSEILQRDLEFQKKSINKKTIGSLNQWMANINHRSTVDFTQNSTTLKQGDLAFSRQ
jgi:hypothetical protein